MAKQDFKYADVKKAVRDHQDVVFHTSSWLRKDWAANEIAQLNQDREEAEIETHSQEEKANRWYESYERKNEQFNRLKEHFDSKLEQTNAALKNKCMILLDLVEAYEENRSYMQPSQSDRIDNLRTRGGFKV